MIDVYIYNQDTDKYTQWKKTEYEIFTNNNKNDIVDFSNIYDGDSEVYSLRLDENKNYILKFGDGIVGKKLSPGDVIYIFYLDTNGINGRIDVEMVPSQLLL
jgi:hypothetical protein